MRRFPSRRAGRNVLGADRLVTDSYTHRYRQFEGGALSAWSHAESPPPHLVVGLHGLGANEQQFGTLLSLDLPADSVYIGLRAPVDYGRESYSWFDPMLDAAHIDYGPTVERVVDFVLAVRDRTQVAPANTTIVGYSQGAPLAVAVSALRSDAAANIVLGSAALPPGLVALGNGRPDRAFVAVGTKDPFVEADSLADVIAHWGTPTGGLTVRHYDIPHVMSPAMAQDISHWISAHTQPHAATSKGASHGTDADRPHDSSATPAGVGDARRS